MNLVSATNCGAAGDGFYMRDILENRRIDCTGQLPLRHRRLSGDRNRSRRLLRELPIELIAELRNYLRLIDLRPQLHLAGAPQ